MRKVILVLVVAILVSLSTDGFSQNLNNGKSSAISIEEFPEYVIITSQNTKLLGGIGILIDYKESAFKDQLRKLESLLRDRDKQCVRNQTDLLNSMSNLGFEFVNAYNSRQVVDSRRDEDGVDDVLNVLDGGSGTYKVNMIFRKKEQYR